MKRIRELAEQAEKLADIESKAFTDNTGKWRLIWNEVYDKNFAELIVRECIGCCEQVISDHVPESVDTWLNGGSQCIDEIKQHFGVEE